MRSSQIADSLKSEGWAIGNVMDGGAVERIASSGAARWAEITGKDKPIVFRAQQEFRHGIDLDYWQECLRVEYETCIPGALFIVQRRPFERAAEAPLLLVQWFSLLRNVVVQEIPPGSQRWAAKGLVVWRARSFAVLGHPDSAGAALRLWQEGESADTEREPELPL